MSSMIEYMAISFKKFDAVHFTNITDFNSLTTIYWTRLPLALSMTVSKGPTVCDSLLTDVSGEDGGSE